MASIRSLRGARSYTSLDNDSSDVAGQVIGQSVTQDLVVKKSKFELISRKIFKGKSGRNDRVQPPGFLVDDLEHKNLSTTTQLRTSQNVEHKADLLDSSFNNNIQHNVDPRPHSDLKGFKVNGNQYHGNESLYTEGKHAELLQDASHDFEDDKFNVKKRQKAEIRLSFGSKLQKKKFMKETRRETAEEMSSVEQSTGKNGNFFIDSTSSEQSKMSPTKAQRFDNLKLVFERSGKNKNDIEKHAHFPKPHTPHEGNNSNKLVETKTKNGNFSTKVKSAFQSLSPSKSRSTPSCVSTNPNDAQPKDFSELLAGISFSNDFDEAIRSPENTQLPCDAWDSGVADSFSSTEVHNLHQTTTLSQEDSGLSSSQREFLDDSWFIDAGHSATATNTQPVFTQLDSLSSSSATPQDYGGCPQQVSLTESDCSSTSSSIAKLDVTAMSTSAQDKLKLRTFRTRVPQSISTLGFIESSREYLDCDKASPPSTNHSNDHRNFEKELPRSSLWFSSVNLNELRGDGDDDGGGGGGGSVLAGSLVDCSRIEEEKVRQGREFASHPARRRKLKYKLTSMETRASQLLFRHTRNMGAGDNLHEEASLLGSDGPEELRNIRLSVSAVRSLVADGSLGDPRQVETEHGPITISVVGDTTKPTILTYHDLGLNHVTNFQSFFQYPDMRCLLTSFSVVSVNAPGQEEGAPALPAGYVYPTMEQLAETVECVRTHLSLRSFIGFGVGLGANVLSRYALAHPQHVDALVLLNCSVGSSGWVEWGYQKVNIRQLRAGTMTTGTVDYLLWHHFGKVDQCGQDVVTVYRQLFENHVNAANLALLIEAYIARSDLGIVREMDPNKKKGARMVRVPVLNVTSNYSPHIEDTVSFNARLDPATSSWMKIQDCGLVLEEQPGKMMEALRLFLQGQGYVVGGASRRASCVPQSGAVHTRRLGARQNSLPLIGGVPGVKGATLLPSVVDDESSPTSEDPPGDLTHQEARTTSCRSPSSNEEARTASSTGPTLNGRTNEEARTASCTGPTLNGRTNEDPEL